MKHWKELQEEITDAIRRDDAIQALYRRIESGKADYKDANALSVKIGEIVGRTYWENRPGARLTVALAEDLLRPALMEDQRLVADACQSIQGIVNYNAGIGMKPVRPAVNKSRVDGLISEAANKEPEKLGALPEQIVNYSQSVVTDSIRVNAEAQWKAGLSPKVVRTAEAKACRWCRSLTGSYDYDAVKNGGNDVWRRHENCRCLIEFVSGKYGRERVDNFRRKDLRKKNLGGLEDQETLRRRREFVGVDTGRDPAKIEARKQFAGLDTSRKRIEGINADTEAAHRKITEDGKVVNPMPIEEYLKRKAELEAEGIEVFAATGGDDLRYMMLLGAEGTYSHGRITHIGAIPSRGTLEEETIHMRQAKKYGELESSETIELFAREVAANRSLLSNRQKLNLDEIDIADIERNLKVWEKRFEDKVGVSYDESNYRRDA